MGDGEEPPPNRARAFATPWPQSTRSLLVLFLGTEYLSKDGLHEGDQCGTSRHCARQCGAFQLRNTAKVGYGEDRNERLKSGPQGTGNYVSPINVTHVTANVVG